MAKSIIIFVVLFIIQGSYQTSLRNDLTDVAEEYLTAYQDAGNIITYVGIHLSSIARNYEHKIDDTLDNENIAAIVQNLQDSIHKVEVGADKNSKSCIDLAFRQAFVTTDELKRGIDSCIASAKAVTTNIVHKLENIDGKAYKIQEEILSGFRTCMGEDLSPETVPCLRDTIKPVKEELTTLTLQVTDTHEIVLQKVEDGIKNLNICLQKEEHDFELKEDTILENLNKCAQGTYQKYTRSTLPDQLKELRKAAKTILEDIRISMTFANADHMDLISSDYNTTVSTAVDKEKTTAAIKKLQDAIRKVESKENSTTCVDAAFRESYIATGELLRGLDTCVARAIPVAPEIKKNISDIFFKLNTFYGDNKRKIDDCGLLSDLEESKCLYYLIEPLKKQLRDFNYKLLDVHQISHNSAEEGIKILDTCLEKEDVNFNEKSKTILADLAKCVESASSTPHKYASKGIMDIIRDIKEKIENILHIISHFPTSIDEIQDKINEIVSHINISTLISKLKDEVDEIFNDGGSNAEKCRPFANDRIDSLVETSENAANKCMLDAENRVDEIKSSISALGEEAQEILGDIKNQTYQCFLENKLNPMEFYNCLEKHVDEFQQRAADLQNKVGDIYENAKEQAEDILKSLAKCMNKIHIDTIKGGQVIIKEVENCVLHSSDTYYMM